MVSLMCLVIALSWAIKLGNMAEVWIPVTNFMSSDGKNKTHGSLRVPEPKLKIKSWLD